MTFTCELMNICMIIDAENQTVLMQNRKKKHWHGMAFPGGHVEKDEGFGESVVREVYEETGLTISDVRLAGIVHWEHKETNERSIIACYITEHFSGDLKKDCDEGHHEWIPIAKIREQKLAPWLDEQLSVFENDRISEMFYRYVDEGPDAPRLF